MNISEGLCRPARPLVVSSSSAGCPQPRTENDKKPYYKFSIGILTELMRGWGQPALLVEAYVGCVG